MSEQSQPNQTPVTTTETPASNELDFSRLTHQNWLFINAFLSTGNVVKAYQMAKYDGIEKSAPYQVFKRLKSHIEAIGDLDVTSRARLQADIKSVLDLPLDPEKRVLNLSEWLKVRKFAASITPEATNSKPQISVLVINRPSQLSKGQQGGEKVTARNEIPPENIIDATIIS